MPRTLRESPTLLSARASLSLLLRSGHTRHDHLAGRRVSNQLPPRSCPRARQHDAAMLRHLAASAGGPIGTQDTPGDTTKMQRR
jgi:hypothetical protein